MTLSLVFGKQHREGMGLRVQPDQAVETTTQLRDQTMPLTGIVSRNTRVSARVHSIPLRVHRSVAFKRASISLCNVGQL